MENFNIFLDYIARTNLFNFAIFFTIIVFLVKKLNVSSKLEKAQVEVKESIVASESTKIESEKRLSAIEEDMAQIEDNINEILRKSEENAELVGEKIIEDAKKSVLIIKENTGKALENSRLILKNELLKRASLASVEVAKSHIIQELIKNEELHDKLIDESINAIEGVEQ